MAIRKSSSTVGESFTVITSTGGTKTATLTRTFPAGTYLIESKAMDTNLEIYLGASDGTQVGTSAAGAKSITASAAFLYVTTINADVNDAITFTLKSAATLATKTDAVWSPPTITDITPSGLPNVNDTTTITGTNFATNVDVKFRKSDDSTLVNAKSTVRGSATSIIATRPDTFAVGDAPYDVIVTNPSTNLSATSLNAITAGAVPVWVTSTTLNTATIDSVFSQTISATDADGGSSITYAIVSGALPTGLSLNTSTGAITGTASGSAATYTVTISATDSGGNTVNRTFTQVLNPGTVIVDYLVVAGGGGGGASTHGHAGGGGGAGGFRTSTGTSGRNSSAMSTLTMTSGNSYTITVGNGGSGGIAASGDVTVHATQGGNSSISGTGITTITSSGGGRGGGGSNGGSFRQGGNGGSGGGSASSDQSILGGGSGTAAEGFDGAAAGTPVGNGSSGSGGGAGGAGNINSIRENITSGGLGLNNSITGSSIAYSTGGACNGDIGTSRVNATNNTGNGGRGAYNNSVEAASCPGANGGSGVVIIRATVQAASTTGSPTYNTSGSYHIYKFTGDGSITY
jgi:Putative Ig domain